MLTGRDGSGGVFGAQGPPLQEGMEAGRGERRIYVCCMLHMLHARCILCLYVAPLGWMACQDSMTEMEIMASLQEIAANRTTIMIAHRLSTGNEPAVPTVLQVPLATLECL